MTIIRASDLNKVDKRKQVIIINEGKVFDVTSFVDVHPGKVLFHIFLNSR